MSAGLFAPELWEKLEKHPETAAMLKDASFRDVVNQLRADPSSLPKHIADERVLKLFTILSQQSVGSMGPTGASTTIIDDDDDVPKDNKDSPMPDAAPPTTSVPRAQPPAKAAPLTDAEKAIVEKDRGTAAYKRRDFAAAIDAYTAGLVLDADNMSLLTNRAAAKLESGDVDGAIADCQQAIEDNSARNLRTDFKIIARAHARMGNGYLKKEDYDNAIVAFEKSLVEFSDRKVRMALKDAERIKKKKDEEAYVDPELSKAVRKEGNELFLAGKFPESIAKYSDAIKRNPKDAAPYSNRAAAYMKLGEFPMAMRDCDRCLELDPNFVKAYIRKGNIHFFMKEYHKCLEIYEKGMKLAPNNKELREGLMKTQMKIQEQQSSGEVDEAQVQQAMKDPEIQQILQDPQMNTLLKQMQEDPKFAAQAMRDPSIATKIQKLVASGFLRVG